MVIKTKPEEFKVFHNLLMTTAPKGYMPWYFPINYEDKDPDGLAIYKKAPKDFKGKKGGWLNDWARLSYEEALQRLEQGFNVGIGARKEDDLILIDIDNWKFKEQMPETLTIKSRSRSGLHGFCFAKKGFKKFNLPTDDYGELRCVDQYVVASGSYVPTTEIKVNEELNSGHINEEEKNIILNDKLLGIYSVEKELTPIEIEYKDLPQIFREYYEKNKISEEVEEEKNNNEYKGINKDKIFDLTFYDILGQNYIDSDRIPHPLHESDTGSNFSLSKDGKLAHCWRHNVSLTPYQFLVVASGHMTCLEAGNGHKNSNAGKSKVKGDKESFKKAKEEAIKKGLIKNEDNFTDAILNFFDYRELVIKFMEKQPFVYDKNNIWWLWDYQNNRYNMIDETDLLIKLDYALRFTAINTTKHTIKNEILEAMKREGRKHNPKQPSKKWLQFKNYVIDIANEEKFKPTHEYFFVNPIPHNVGESDDIPVIDKLFTDWVGDNKQLLYEVMAYCLYSEYPLHRLFCLHGRGRNGKSKYLELIRRIIGQENCTSTELDILTSNRFESAKLYKKLVCLMSETNYSTLKSTSLLKKLVGQDMIGYEFKNKMPFDDYNYAKLLIATNSVPNTTDKSDGYYSRWVLIEFANRFKEGKDILADIPNYEYENLCFKLTKILKNLLIKGEFYNEGSIEYKKKVYEEKSNPLNKFLSEKTSKDFDGYIFKRKFKDALDSWMKENGYGYSLSDMDLSSQMKGIYEEHKKGSGETRYWAWCGLSWKIDIPNEESVNTVQPVKGIPITPISCFTKIDRVDSIDTLDKQHINLYWDIKCISHLPCTLCKETPTNEYLNGKWYCETHFNQIINTINNKELI